MENNQIQANLQKESAQFIRLMKFYEYEGTWKLKEEKPVRRQRMNFQGRKVIKASVVVNFDFSMMCNLFADVKFMRTLQQGVSKFDIPYDNNVLKVIHVVMELPGPVSNRQMVVVNTYRNEGDKVYVGNRSCKYPVQLDQDAVLAQLKVGGFILTQMDETKTMVTNISDVDIKGNIPDFIVNSMSKMRVEVLYTLEKKIKEYVEKK